MAEQTPEIPDQSSSLENSKKISDAVSTALRVSQMIGAKIGKVAGEIISMIFK